MRMRSCGAPCSIFSAASHIPPRLRSTPKLLRTAAATHKSSKTQPSPSILSTWRWSRVPPCHPPATSFQTEHTCVADDRSNSDNSSWRERSLELYPQHGPSPRRPSSDEESIADFVKHLTELCCLLVEDFYGDLCAQVFATLAKRGRVTLRALLQQSNLPAKHIYHGLTVLVQQHLVLHHTTVTSPTYFEVDWNGAYGLVRNGKILTTMEDRFGGKAVQVVAALLQLGHANVEDLEQAFTYGKRGKHARSTSNGTVDAMHDTPFAEAADQFSDHISSREDLHSILHRLLQAGFVRRLHERTYIPETDKQNAIEETLKETVFEGQRTSGPKMKVKFDAEVKKHKRKLEDNELDFQDHVTRPGKRRKLNGVTMNGSANHRDHSGDHGSVVLAGSLTLKVDLEKCLVALRSDRLVRHAQRLLGDTTSRVYEAFLRVYEDKVRRCRSDEEVLLDAQQGDDLEDDDELRITTEDVMTLYEREGDRLEWLDIRFASGDDRSAASHKRAFKPSKGPREHQEGSIVRRNRYLQEIGAHLAILAEHQLHFTHKISTLGFGEFSIPMTKLVQAIRDQEVENVLAAKYGSVAVRIIRLLRPLGKLDEKQICDRGLMRMKDVRNILDKMHENSYIESQEVPRDNTRQPSRAYYLWYFDQDRFERMVLEKSYVAMSRCLQRRKVQRGLVRDVIEKAERTDVIGHEDEFLTESDKEYLHSWQEQEAKLLTQIGRMDDTVSLIRDF